MTDSSNCFGGYTQIPWKSHGEFKKDKGDSFVFKLSNQTDQVEQFKVMAGKDEVFHEDDRLFSFPGAIAIYSECNEHSENYTTLGKYYAKPSDPGIDANMAQNYLNNGKVCFRVKELEVY